MNNIPAPPIQMMIAINTQSMEAMALALAATCSVEVMAAKLEAIIDAPAGSAASTAAGASSVSVGMNNRANGKAHSR